MVLEDLVAASKTPDVDTNINAPKADIDTPSFGGGIGGGLGFGGGVKTPDVDTNINAPKADIDTPSFGGGIGGFGGGVKNTRRRY